MSIYSNVTEQKLINLRKLAEEPKYQRALKIKKRVLKQTHDIKKAENLSPITKKLEKVNETIEKLGKIAKESNPPQLVIQKTHNALPIENEQMHSGVIYDTSLENTLNRMKNIIGFFNIEKRDNGDIIWKGFAVEKASGKKLKSIEKIYDITSGIQKVLTDTSNIPMKKLNDQDREKFINNLENFDFEKYKAIRGEFKLVRCKQSKTNFKKHNLEDQRIPIIIPSNIIDIYTRLEVLLGLKPSGHNKL